MANKKQLTHLDGLSDVLGLKSTDRVLVMGANAKFPFLKDEVQELVSASKFSQLEQLIKKKKKFDKVIIARESVLSEKEVVFAEYVLQDFGLVVFFSEDEGLRAGFEELIESNFPEANVWQLDSNVGSMVVTDMQS